MSAGPKTLRPDEHEAGNHDVAALSSMAMAAAQRDNHRALILLLRGGALPDGMRDGHGNTPLLVAAQRGFVECVRALIDAGADLGATNLQGEGAVRIAFANGHTSLGVTIAAEELRHGVISRPATPPETDSEVPRMADDYRLQDPPRLGLVDISLDLDAVGLQLEYDEHEGFVVHHIKDKSPATRCVRGRVEQGDVVTEYNSVPLQPLPPMLRPAVRKHAVRPEHHNFVFLRALTTKGNFIECILERTEPSTERGAARQYQISGDTKNDWITCAEDHGIDIQAVFAATDLDLDLTLFDGQVRSRSQGQSAPSLSSTGDFLDAILHDVVPEKVRSFDVDPCGTQVQGDEKGYLKSSSVFSGTGRSAVPRLQFTGHRHISARESTDEKELLDSAMEARQAETDVYNAACLGNSMYQRKPVNQTRPAWKKGGKATSKNRHTDVEGSMGGTTSTNRGAHVSEAIALMGKTQAALESEHTKVAHVQKEADDLDREIQEQLDAGLLESARFGDVKGMRSWMDKGAMLDTLDSQTGDSVLHLTAAFGDKKACKISLRILPELLDMKNLQGEIAADTAIRNGHTELGEYLNSKAEYLHSRHEDLGDDGRTDAMQGHDPVNRDEDCSKAVENSVMFRSDLSGRTVEGDIIGMMTDLSLWELKSHPQDMEKDVGLDVTDLFLENEGHPGVGAINDSSGDSACSDHDILACAEEFLQTVAPAYGKDTRHDTHTDLLLHETEKDLPQSPGDPCDDVAQSPLWPSPWRPHLDIVGDERDPEEEFDVLACLDQILSKNPVPTHTTLSKIASAEDRDKIFQSRGLELKKLHQDAAAAARPRVTTGIALIIANLGPPSDDGLGTCAQFTQDLILLRKKLPDMGFGIVDVRCDLTRVQVLDQVSQQCDALCANGNLADADSFLLIVLSTGGPGSFDVKPMPGANPNSTGQCAVAYQEIVNLIKVIPADKTKTVMFSICGDPHERAKALVQVPLRPLPCSPDFYQKILDGCQNVMLVVNCTSGVVHWTPTAGSLVVRFFVEEFVEEGFDKHLAEIVVGTRRRLLDYFYSRRGTGQENCPIGRAAYDKFFVQTPLFTDGPTDCRLMLGPALRWAKGLCGANFQAQEGFVMTKMDTVVMKDKSTENYVHAYSMKMPRTVQGVHINLENAVPNLAWEIVLHELGGSEEVYIGAAVLPHTVFKRATSSVLKAGAKQITRMSSGVNAFSRATSSGSNPSGADSKLKRAASLRRGGSTQRTGSSSGEIVRAPSGESSSGAGFRPSPAEVSAASNPAAITRAPSGGFSRTGSSGPPEGTLDLRTLLPVGKTSESWSISADGRVHPDVESEGKFAGLSAGSRIQIWQNREKNELEITVDDSHVQKVWKSAVLAQQLLVPAITIGPSTTCTVELTKFWAW